MYNEKEIQAAVDLYEKIHSLSRDARQPPALPGRSSSEHMRTCRPACIFQKPQLYDFSTAIRDCFL